MSLRWIFLARTVPKGKGWVEYSWGAAIVALAYIVGYMLTETSRRTTLSFAGANNIASAIVGIIAAYSFSRNDFRIPQALTIAGCAALIVNGSYETEISMQVLKLVGGYFVLVRAFSIGPTATTATSSEHQRT